MINLALFNESFSPQCDGVAVTVENYARIISERYGKAYVITPAHPDRKQDFSFPVWEYASSAITVADQYRVGIPSVPKLAKKFNETPIDIIHSHTPFTSGLLAGRMAARYNLPHVASFHSKYKDDINMRLKVNLKMPGEIVGRYVTSFYNRCDYIWSVSQGTAKTLREYGYLGEILVMPNGCDMPVSHRTEAGRNQVVKTYHLNGAHPILLFVGRHTFTKNTDIIIKALGALARHGQKFNMLFVGDGEDAARMVEMVKAQGLDKMVHFAGKVSDREALKQIYTSADLFVFPSVYDNAPLVVREAAACGCASALIKGSNSAEGLEDGVNAFLSAETVEDFALTLYAALSNSDLAAVGQNARRDIYISWHEVLAMVASEYEKILADWEKKKPKRPHSSENFSELMSYFDIYKDRDYDLGWKRALRREKTPVTKIAEKEEKN